MKIFGKNFMTKKDLKNIIVDLMVENEDLAAENEELMIEISDMLESFPFYIGQPVYDITLRNSKGRWTKTNPSLEHSLINEVVVDEKNYFSIVERYERNDVFLTHAEARAWLESICA